MKYWKHFSLICRHKWYVGVQCFKMGLYWQGIVHDLSKFSWSEFVPSARYWQGNRSPLSAEREAIGYSAAWLHHKGRNKHHWEYWVDFVDGKAVPVEMPIKYVKEMVCDMIGAAKTYGTGTATDYYLKHYNKFILDPFTRMALEKELFFIEQDFSIYRICETEQKKNPAE